MLSLLGLGFLLGMRHALEADHAAAVASLVSRGGSLLQTVKQGIVWGLGHSLTLLLFGSVVLILGTAIPEEISAGLELAVGLMLVGLGLDVLRRLRNERIHFHAHQHPNQPLHIHAHSHSDNSQHAPSTHHHTHAQGFPYRALLVGFMHGMAGSAALILLTLQATISPYEAVGYILIFGLGATVGMGLLSVIMAVPLWYSARSLTWVHNGLQGVIGLSTIVLGLFVIYRHVGFIAG